MRRRQRLWLHRALAAALIVFGIPALVAIRTLADEAPIREGQPSPRTVIADQTVRIVDQEATENARRTAREAVAPVEVFDADAQAEIVADVRQVFDDVLAARELTGDASTVDRAAQEAYLRERVPTLSEAAVDTLLDLDDSAVQEVARETIEIAQVLARQRVSEADLETAVDQQLRTELALRSFPEGVYEGVVAPVVRTAMRPTVQIDFEATDATRERAAQDVAEVERTWRAGETIVREDDIVDVIEVEALRQAGELGTEPAGAFLRAFVAMVVVTAVLTVLIQLMRPAVLDSGRKVVLLASVVTGYGLLVAVGDALVGSSSGGWWYALPAAAMAMLAALMVSGVVALGLALPAVVVPLLVAPQMTGLIVFVVGAVLYAVPLTSNISSRGDLRSASLRLTLALPVLAVASMLVFGPRVSFSTVVLAGIINGVITAVIVQGLLPFLETLFRLPTVTALLDLADRNHPLLRELEQKALGSYNHSVMVASLVERACRTVGANALLGSVAALYHDIGKVRQPHFFIENQQGIRNPHDDLEPEVSAVIIQEHVSDGVEMAREHHLPPEVVACIGSHHGTMIVTYFYRKALDRVGGDLSEVDVDHFRYKGHKPRAKEAGVLLMADCCEAATRSAAMDRGTLPRADIESICDRLIQERVDDGQFASCDLTFREMSEVRDAIVEALVGIYHPRIAYPDREEQVVEVDASPVAG